MIPTCSTTSQAMDRKLICAKLLGSQLCNKKRFKFILLWKKTQDLNIRHNFCLKTTLYNFLRDFMANLSNHHGGLQQEPKIQWIICGLVYLLLVILSNHPRIVAMFPHGSTISLLIMLPMVGIAYMLRDGVQYLFEDTPEKRAKSSGFWPSMIFVGIGVFFTLFYADPSARIAGAVAYAVASMVDAVVFSKLHRHGLAYRLLLSNVVGAVADCWIFMAVMNWGHQMDSSFGDAFISAFLQISPALLLFLLSGTVLSRVLGVFDYVIVKRTKPF